MKLIYFLVFSLVLLRAANGDIVCEELPAEICSFSISSAGMRCLLETSVSVDGTTQLHCQTSNVAATNIQEHIETDDCMAACGVDRKSLGISSDSLLSHRFIAKLCSPQCQQNCPNIVDLYSILASEEGSSLPELCKAMSSEGLKMPRRFLSSSAAFGPESATAFAPASSPSVDCAPAPM